MAEWNFKTLSSIMSFSNGKKRPKENGNIPIYGGNGILGYANSCNYENSVIVGRVGIYCGSVYYEKGQCWVSDNAIAALPLNDNDIHFIYYLLKNLRLNGRCIGTSQPLLTQSILNNIKCYIPEINVQRKIASILSAIDDKIERNTAINENLEQQAQAIYAHMFMERAAESWKTGILSDIAVITMGQSPKGDTFNEIGNGAVFYQGRTDFGFRFPTRRLYTTEPKRFALCGDALISVRAPVGDLNVAYEKCCIGRGLAAIHSKDNHQSFLLYTLFTLNKQLDIFNGEGTVFGSINKESLNSMEITIPPIELINKFESIANPIDRTIRNNYEEICRLQAIRDSLLPKLMNGEIDVSAVKI